ncbi:uncharacterized protein LOC142592639 isoform X1 [Dermacentor variabilis]|uniref:uncharacterized protein LOC142592639 isoform X1 n=1 Tax=Dermacentor variabilis TaxID=34621 RepID=UPI003F5BE386
MLATPESPPMSSSMVLREAQRIVQNLEELATTPLVDTRQITLVNFTLQSPELETSGALRCKLFQEEEAPEHADTSTENLLSFAEEHLGAISLGTSTPLVLSPSAPAFGESFTVDTADGTGHEVCAIPAKSPCPSPCPADVPPPECEMAGPGTLVPGGLPSGSGGMPSSPGLVTHDEALELCRAGKGAAEVLADDAPHKTCSSATNNETHVQASDCEADSSCHHVDVKLDDGNLDSSPSEPLAALGESFVVARESPTADAVALNGSPVAVAETTFAIPAAPPVELATKRASAPSAKADTTMIMAASCSSHQQSSKGTAVVRKSLPSPRPAPVQRPAGRLSMATKPRAVLGRPSAATRTASDTTFARNAQAPARPSLAPKGVERPKPGSASGVSKPARRVPMPSVPTVTQRPAAQLVPALPEPRRPLGPSAGGTAALRRSLQPVSGATCGTARGSATRLSTVPEKAARQSLLPGARRSVAAVPRAMTTASQPVVPQPKAKTGLPVGPVVQPSQLPRSRLRPPSNRVSSSVSQVPRRAFSPASCLLPVPESPVAARLSSTPARPNVPLASGSPELTPIRKKPDRH